MAASAQSQPMAVGQYVQYNPTVDSPRASAPSNIESTYGIVRQTINQKGELYYQVVWDPASMYPKVGFYHQDELTPITAQDAQNIVGQLQSGTYTPNLGTQGSNYQDTIPQEALPPQVQGAGSFSPQNPGSTTQPSIVQQD